MRVVFILPGRNLSGGVRVTVIAANKLMERGHEVRIFYRRKSFKRIIRDFLYGDLFRNMRDWLDDFKGKKTSFKNIEDCTFKNDEIIIGVGMWASKELGKLKLLSNPKLQYIHGATPWDQKLMKEALSLNIPKIAVSTHLKAIIESYGAHVLSIIPNGVDQNEYYPVFNESERYGLGTIYSSHPAKDPATIERVLNKFLDIKKDLPVRVFSTERRPKKLSRVEFYRRPPINKVREIYSRSTIWLLLSRSEGFPAPILEAMACGCIVVATDCGGPKDIIIDGENGFLVSIGDAEGIVKKVCEIFKNPSLLKYMQENGKKTCERFTWESTINALENVLSYLH